MVSPGSTPPVDTEAAQALSPPGDGLSALSAARQLPCNPWVPGPSASQTRPGSAGWAGSGHREAAAGSGEARGRGTPSLIRTCAC